jgi:hypothetical protein
VATAGSDSASTGRTPAPSSEAVAESPRRSVVESASASAPFPIVPSSMFPFCATSKTNGTPGTVAVNPRSIPAALSGPIRTWVEPRPPSRPFSSPNSDVAAPGEVIAISSPPSSFASCVPLTKSARSEIWRRTFV